MKQPAYTWLITTNVQKSWLIFLELVVEPEEDVHEKTTSVALEYRDELITGQQTSTLFLESAIAESNGDFAKKDNYRWYHVCLLH